MKLCCTAVMMVLLFGCGTASRVERLDTGQTDPLVFTPRSGARSEDWHEASRERVARQSSLAAQLVFRSAVLDVSGSTRRISAELSKLKASGRGLASGNGVFLRYVDYGVQQLRWMDAQLAAATRLANTASEVEDPDMQLALLRLAGPRLEASMMGSLLLAVWLDFLTLADVALRQHLYPWRRSSRTCGAGRRCSSPP
uniref:hypothetical protein n=1 Tax=Archangium lipolyticum TaxID=2970465 RepID=UPI00214A5912|nr:hypothetical protein [Archangium lipolyticum]